MKIDKQNNGIEFVRQRQQGWRRGWVAHALAALILSGYGGATVAASSAALGYTPKYATGFGHFDYVSATAPKAGELTLSAFGSFDKLNPFTLKGLPAAGVGELVFEPLMEKSLDEPYSVYAHLAEDIQLAKDGKSVIFRLNPRARFSDGTPVTALDVKFSFDTLMSKQAHPRFRFYWADIKRAVALDARTVRFDFAKVNPELHLIAAQMPVFARSWVGDKPFDKLSTTPPIGSGPYVLESFDFGKKATYRRNPDYWAKDLNTRRGQYNFDRVIFKYYRDRTALHEAFKAGEFEFVFENSSKKWARDYVGPQFDSGQIKRAELKHRNNAGMQGFVFNLRRPIFQDIRVRRAITLGLDFEWSNRKLFFNQYTRCDSYFSNSELAATGLPGPDELSLLEPFRRQLPPAVFTKVWRPPSTLPPGSLRDNLKQARDLLNAAGWTLKNGTLQNQRGDQFRFEVLLYDDAFERILAPFARNLEKLGIRMTYRKVDPALYQRRTDRFDYDMVVDSIGQSQSPGNELMGLWHSTSATQEGSNNTIGLKDPVVDALIDKIIYAPDRKRLVAATRALDRVLLHGEYLVPNWYIATHRIAYWDHFGMPEKMPLYFGAESLMLSTWWKKSR